MPRFRVRDLFALVAFCAIAVGWWADRTQLKRDMEGRLSKVELEKSDLEAKLRFLQAYDVRGVPRAR